MIGPGTVVLANIDDWMTLIFVVIAIITFIVRQLGAAAKKLQGPKPPAAPQGGMPQPVQPQPVAAKPRDQADSLRSEVEKFLRRAQEQLQKQTQPTPDRAETEEPKRPQRQRRKVRPETATAPPSPPAPIVETPREALTQRHLQATNFETREADLSRLDQGAAAAGVARHVHEVFDRSVVSMDADDRAADGGTAVAVAEESTVVQQVAAMLRDPQSARQAVVLSEIFTRREW